MPTAITEFVLNHPIFCHHNHHHDFRDFEAQRSTHGFRSLLGYAEADLVTAAGPRGDGGKSGAELLAAMWPKIRTTGYGRAVTLGCRALFDLEFEPARFTHITEALQSAFEGRSPLEVYDYFLREKANTKWVVKDHRRSSEGEVAPGEALYPDYYRFTWRADGLFSIVDDGPVREMEQHAGTSILSLEQLASAVHASIDSYRMSTPFAAIKVGMAYQRDLDVSLPTRHEAEIAFHRIRTPNAFHKGRQQRHGAVNAAEGRALSDYLFHAVMEHAQEEDIPVQIHTGYLAGNWGSLNGTKASLLIPVFDRYRRVRFDIFHGSWPWMSELGAIAKNYPNVYPDLCWAWTMSPAESERALCEWLDGVPFNKIFGYGADTGWPWCDVGYALQARTGIARVLQQKVEAGYFSSATAQEVASSLLLRNGEEFYGLAE